MLLWYLTKSHSRLVLFTYIASNIKEELNLKHLFFIFRNLLNFKIHFSFKRPINGGYG